MPLYQQVLSNTKATARKDTLEGRECLVVPMVMLTEGVHAGSGGPLFYPKDELSKTPVTWNHKPVVVYHPTLNGEGVSACEKDVLETHKVGVILNTRWDDKLRAEAWLYEDALKRVDPRVLTAIENNQMMEVSTGLYTDNEELPGEWNTEKYTAIARNYRPDHLAILPDQIGACSVKDGAGLLRINTEKKDEKKDDKDKPESTVFTNTVKNAVLRAGCQLVNNELSFSKITSSLSSLLSSKYGKPGKYWDGWISDVFSDSVVFYGEDMKLYMIGYSATDSTVSLVGEAKEVSRVVEYKTKDGKAFVANSVEGSSLLSLVEKETAMPFDKKAHVTSLIGNGFEEKDRTWLEALADDNLAKILPKTTTTVQTNTVPVQTPAPTPVQTNTTPAPAPTLEQYIASAPPVLQEILQNGVQAHNDQKASLVKSIIANKANVFSEAFLNTKTIQELKGLASLAGASAQPVGNGMFLPGVQIPVANYAGLAGPIPTNNAAAGPQQHLPSPNWDDDAK